MWATTPTPTTSSTSRSIAAGTDRNTSSGLPAVLLADAYGDIRRGGGKRDQAGRLLVAHQTKIIEAEKAAPEIAQQAIEMVRAFMRWRNSRGAFRRRAARLASEPVSAGVGPTAAEAAELEGAALAQTPYGRGGELRSGTMDGAEHLLLRWRRAHRQQHQ